MEISRWLVGSSGFRGHVLIVCVIGFIDIGFDCDSVVVVGISFGGVGFRGRVSCNARKIVAAVRGPRAEASV